MITSRRLERPDPALIRSRIGVAVAFLANGAMLATWASRIPAVMGRLGLTPGQLGLALLAEVGGVLLVMQLAGPLCGRLGSRPVTRAGVVLMSLAMLGPALAWSLPSLVVGLLLLGGGNGLLDVAMNAHGVTVERRYGRPILSGFHALWSAGGILGALCGGLAAEAGVPVLAHFAVAAAILGVGAMATTRWLLPASADAIGSTTTPTGAAASVGVERAGAAGPVGPAGVGTAARRWWARRARGPAMDRRVLVLGLIGFACLGEGAAANWSAVYLRGLGASPGMAAAGLGAFSLTMTAGRLLGDRLNARFGAVRLARVSGVIAAVGLGAGLAVGTPTAAVAGFALHGVGLSCIIPLVFSAAGRIGGPHAGTALARVATFSYAGPLIGPVVIGTIADRTSLATGLLLPVALAGVVALAAGNLRPATPEPLPAGDVAAGR
jgi:MFS family permease